MQDPPAQAVDRLVAADIDQPGTRVRRDAVRRPLLHRRSKGILQALLGELEIANEADQRREDATRLVAEDRLDAGRGYPRFACHGTSAANTRIGRTPFEPTLAARPRRAP